MRSLILLSDKFFQFLSMKLAVINPELELAVEDLSVKQVKTHSLDPQDQIVIIQELIIIWIFVGYEISVSGLLYKSSSSSCFKAINNGWCAIISIRSTRISRFIDNKSEPINIYWSCKQIHIPNWIFFCLFWSVLVPCLGSNMFLVSFCFSHL